MAMLHLIQMQIKIKRTGRQETCKTGVSGFILCADSTLVHTPVYILYMWKTITINLHRHCLCKVMRSLIHMTTPRQQGIC